MHTTTVTDHKLNGLNEAIDINAGPPGPGNASHEYEILLTPPGRPTLVLAQLQFQNGPIASPQDFNGLTNEALLAILIHRMRGFQEGPFACRDNAIALTHLEDALLRLQKRTRERVQRGVEGTLKP